MRNFSFSTKIFCAKFIIGISGAACVPLAAYAYTPVVVNTARDSGIAATYTDEIKAGQKVEMSLSDDYKKLIITGAVNQIITSAELASDTLTDEVVDYFSSLVDFSQDFNNDGYNDLSILVMNGTGLNTYHYFLYDPFAKKFIYHKDLSQIENLGFSSDKKVFIQELSNGEAGIDTTTYRLDAKNKIYKLEHLSCSSNKDFSRTKIVKFYLKERVRYSANGKVISRSSKKLPKAAFNGHYVLCK